MILSILTVIHFVFSLAAVYAGAEVLFGLLAGKILGKCTIAFLRCSLAASIAGLLFPFPPLVPTHWLAMLAIYASGAAFLAWCKFGLAGRWRDVYVLSIAMVFCLDVFAAGQAFPLVPTLMERTSTQSKPVPLTVQLGIVVFVAVVGFVLTRKLRNRRTHML